MVFAPVSPIGGVPPIGPAGGARPAEQANPTGRSFADTLEAAMASIEETQHHADDKLAELAAGKTPDIHGTMIALQEADITLRTMVSVRDKFVDAYQQLINMQI